MAINLTKIGGLVEIEGLGIPVYMVDSSSTRPSFKLLGTDNLLCLSSSIGVISIPFASVTDFSVDGDPVTDLADFKTKIATVFPNGGGGPSTTPTLDEVLAQTPNTITEDRIVELDSNTFKIQQGGEDLLTIVDGNSRLRSFNDTDDGNEAYAQAQTSDTESDAYLTASFNDEAKIAEIHAHSDATTATLEYTADKHSFNSILNLAVFTNSAPTDGDVWRADNTNNGLKVRINGVTKTITVS